MIKEMRNDVIRKKYASDVPVSDLVNEYGVSHQRIYQIINWKAPMPVNYFCKICKEAKSHQGGVGRHRKYCEVCLKEGQIEARKQKKILHKLQEQLSKKNGKLPQGRDYVREQVRLRDKYTCQDCGLKRTPNDLREHNEVLETLKGRIKSLDVHHLNGMCGKNSQGYDKPKEIPNLITLCHRCHYNRPEHRTKSREYALNLRKVQCIRGHPILGETSKERKCRPCANFARRRWYAKNKLINPSHE